jgi:hypothetical protein
VCIKGDGFSITLEFNEDESIKRILVYERSKNSQLSLSSACYVCKGNLLSKCAFAYNEEGDISQLTVFDANNTISCKVVYLSNYLTPNCKCFDKFGALLHKSGSCCDSPIPKDYLNRNSHRSSQVGKAI